MKCHVLIGGTPLQPNETDKTANTYDEHDP